MGFGAVNLLAKQAVLPGQHGELEASYGHYETSLLRGAFEWKTQNNGLVVSASQRQSEGHRTNADGETQALYTNLTHALSEEWTATILASFTHSTANDPQPVGTSLPIVENYETNHQFYLTKLSYSADSLDFELKLHLEDGEGNWLQWHQAPPPPFPSQSLRSVTDYRNYGAKSKLSGQLDSLSWTVGLDWDRFGGALTEAYSVAATTEFADEYFQLTSPYALITHNTFLSNGNEWQISAGARYLHHSVFDAEATGQLGLNYTTERSRSYLQLSRSANYPGVSSASSVVARPWQVGDDWRELEAETINHVEVGTQWHLNPSLILDLSLFQDKVENAIRLIAPPPSGYILNLGSYTTQGLETMIRYQHTNWSVFSGLTWMHSNSDVPNTPDWAATVGFHYRKGPWKLAADYQHLSEQLTYNPGLENPHSLLMRTNY